MIKTNISKFSWIEKTLKNKISIAFGSWEDFLIESHNELKFTRLSVIALSNQEIQEKWKMYTDQYWSKLEKLKSLGIDNPRDFLMKIHEEILESWQRDSFRQELLDLSLSEEEVDNFLKVQNIK